MAGKARSTIWWPPFVIGWTVLAVEGIDLVNRTYENWRCGTCDRAYHMFVYSLIVLVVCSQFAVGRYSFLATRWARDGETYLSFFAWLAVAFGIVGAIAPAYIPLDAPSEIRRPFIWAMAAAQSILPSLVIFLEFDGFIEDWKKRGKK